MLARQRTEPAGKGQSSMTELLPEPGGKDGPAAMDTGAMGLRRMTGEQRQDAAQECKDEA